MKMIKNLAVMALLSLAVTSQAATYEIDTKGAHAFIQFKIKHLGYSWLLGRFNTFSGSFEYDAKAPEKSSINVEVDTRSVDSNHAERDKHLRGKDFLYVSKYPTASFVSTAFMPSANGGTLKGNLTLHGVTKSVEIAVTKIGEGADPWGGYRVGFDGTTKLLLEDYNIKNILGPASAELELELYIEGIRQ